MNFENEERILLKIKNKEGLPDRDISYVERGLKMLVAFDEMLNETLGISEEDIFKIKYDYTRKDM